MYGKVHAYMEEYRMLLPGERVIVGLSGGADSVCLLYLLYLMKEELNIELKAVHVHHGLRGEEADRDAEYAKELSHEWGVPFVCVHVKVAEYAASRGISEEEAGRKLRYQLLEEEKNKWGASKIAVAHHADDQAETILYHLFRGSGLKGLGGIRPVRGCIVRPLLCVNRREIVDYLKEKEIRYCDDSTNASCDYARNRLRNQLIPMIKEQINQGAVPNILRAGELASQADDYLEQAAAHILNNYGIRAEDGNGYGIPAYILLEEPEIIRTYVVKEMIGEMAGHRQDVTASHIGDAVCLLEKGVGRQIDLPYGLFAVRGYEELWIKMKIADYAVDKRGKKDLPQPVFTTFPYKKGQEFPENSYTKWFDYDRMSSAPTVRYRETGDYIALAGGGRKTVKSFMIDEKIPRQDRDRIPLLADEDHIIWIVGYRISEYYKITDNTHTILQIQLGGEDDRR